MTPFKPKKKKCRNTDCRQEFVTQRPMQTACSVPCAMALARKQRERAQAEKEKRERAETRAAKAKSKSRGDYSREAQSAFNAFIRERDHALPCISCGRHHQGQWHAGHYRTVGSHPELRFDELNCHKQCAPCNNHKSGDIVNYRITLVQRIGEAAVAWLEGPHEPKKYSVDELKEIKRLYNAKRRELARAREGGADGRQQEAP